MQHYATCSERRCRMRSSWPPADHPSSPERTHAYSSSFSYVKKFAAKNLAHDPRSSRLIAWPKTGPRCWRPLNTQQGRAFTAPIRWTVGSWSNRSGRPRWTDRTFHLLRSIGVGPGCTRGSVRWPFTYAACKHLSRIHIFAVPIPGGSVAIAWQITAEHTAADVVQTLFEVSH